MKTRRKMKKFALCFLMMFSLSPLPGHEKEGEKEIPAAIVLGHWRHNTHEIIQDLQGLGSTKRHGEYRITSPEEAAKAFQKDYFEKLKKEIDFEKQEVVMFHVVGSGATRVDCYVSIGESPKVMFVTVRGVTKDYVKQVYVYAVRKGIELTDPQYPGGR